TEGAPNVIGGSRLNQVAVGIRGATIAGGGATNAGFGPFSNTIASDFASVGGGLGNAILADSPFSGVVGGQANVIQEAQHGAIGGGSFNRLEGGNYGVIGGGALNAIGSDANYTGIGSGYSNTIEPGADDARIGGGRSNIVARPGATIGGGLLNRALGYSATLSGGENNTSSGYQSVVGGGYGNVGSGDNATVAGGRLNVGQGEGATVAGGANNFGGAEYGVIGGGIFNTNAGSHATVAGGRENLASGTAAVVGGGEANRATKNYAAVSGGGHNLAAGLASTVAGGGGFADESEGNSAAGDWSTVSGGRANRAAGEFSVVAGGENNLADGRYAVVPGGMANRAQGRFSFAAGENTHAEHDGTFVWADSSFSGILRSTAPNQFLVRAAGGVGINTNQPQSALHVAGTVTADGFRGLGAGLSGVNADRLDGRDSTDFAPTAHLHSASDVASGTLADARLSSNIPRLNAAQTFTAANQFNHPGNVFAGTFQGEGASLSNLDASKVSAGTLSDARLSANIPRLNAPATFTAQVSAPVMQASNVVADASSLNNGALVPGLLLGGTTSGEGIASKRTGGGNQYGLDFFSAFTSRLAIENNGAIHFGAGNAFASYGDAQSSIYVLRGTSSGPVYGELFQSANQRVRIPVNSTWTFRVFVAGRASNGKAAGYCFRGFLENESGTVRMLETVNTEDNAEDDTGWDVNLRADDTYDALIVTAKGNTGDSVRWTAVVYTCEVKW
ncbi:MAG: hypothetical protein QHJ82_14180, partial [Verrucomicrobiota bacterium]|nr:hypothetical protein [Verrucomicrobiota bacterium]